MKRKSILKILTVALMVVLSIAILPACDACNANKHEFASKWDFDNTYHWHKCLTEGHDDIADKEKHTYKEEITKEPDYGVTGEKKFTCKECGRNYTETLPGLNAKDATIALAEGVTLDKTYDGTAVMLTPEQVVINGDGETSITYKAAGDEEYSETAPKAAGEYTVKVSVKATAEWKAAEQVFPFTIAKKALNATASKTYDGNATVNATLKGVVEGDTVSAKVVMTSKDVDASVDRVELEGADVSNYVCPKENATVTIAKKKLTAKAEITYDGVTKTAEATVVGILSGDNVKANVTFSSPNAGATVSNRAISGTDKNNYSLADSDFVASIKPKALTATANKTYDGKATINATLNGVVAGDTVSAIATMSSKNAGATLQSVALNGASKNNYTLAKSDVSAKIDKHSVDAIMSEIQWFNGKVVVFNANDEILSEQGVVGGDDIRVEITLADSEVGTFEEDPQIAISGADKDNYDFSQTTIMIEIVKRQLTLPENLTNFERFASEPRVDGVYKFKNVPTEVWLISEKTDVEAYKDYTLQAKDLTLSDNVHYEVKGLDTNTSQVKLTVTNDVEFYMSITGVSLDTAGKVKLEGTVNRGRCDVDDTLYLPQIGKEVTVLSVTGDSDDYVYIGHHAIITVDGVELDEISTGMIITSDPYINSAYRFEMDYTLEDETSFTSNINGIWLYFYKYKKASATPYSYGYNGGVSGRIIFAGSPMQKGETRRVTVELLAAASVWEEMEIEVRYSTSSKIYGHGTLTSLTPATNVKGSVNGYASKTFTVVPVAQGDTSIKAVISKSTFTSLIEPEHWVTLNVFCGGTEIAKITRGGVGVGELAYDFHGGTWDSYYITFNLFKNKEGFTDGEGKWISDATQITLSLNVAVGYEVSGINVNEKVNITNLTPGGELYYSIYLGEDASDWYKVSANLSQIAVYNDSGVKVDLMGKMLYVSGGSEFYIKYTNTTSGILTTNFTIENQEVTIAKDGSKDIALPKGDVGDGIFFKITLTAMANPFWYRYATLSQETDAINANAVSIYNEDYSVYNPSWGGKTTIYLPSKNLTEKTVYMLISYVKALTADVTISFNKVIAAPNVVDLNVGTGVSGKFVNANSYLRYGVNLTANKTYKIEITSSEAGVVESVTLPQFFNPNYVQEYDKKINENFTATMSGKYYFSLKCKSEATFPANVTIRVVQV